MLIFNITNTLILLLLLVVTVLLIYLAQEINKCWISLLPLIFFLFDLVVHTVQLLTLPTIYSYLSSTLAHCIIIDLLFVFITFLAFLWVDDKVAKAMNKKSIDNSLDWFWKQL